MIKGRFPITGLREKKKIRQSGGRKPSPKKKGGFYVLRRALWLRGRGSGQWEGDGGGRVSEWRQHGFPETKC